MLGRKVKSLEFASGLEVGEHLDDVFGHRWWSGEMVTGRLETVLISDPIDGEYDTIGRCERVRSLGDGTDIFGFLSDLLLDSALLDLGAISALITV